MATNSTNACIIVLFHQPPELNQAAIQQALQAADPSLASARYEIQPRRDDGIVVSSAQWENHGIELVHFDRQRFPAAAALESSLSPAAQLRPLNVGEEVRSQALLYRHAIALHYIGAEPCMIEQYALLGAMATVLAPWGGLVAVNERGLSAVPLEPFTTLGDNLLATLRCMLLPQFCCGFILFNIAGTDGVWFRTVGAPHLDFPELIVHAASADLHFKYFKIFGAIFHLMREHGEAFGGPGSLIRLPGEAEGDADDLLYFREPTDAESSFLPSSSIIIEEITESDMERIRAEQEALVDS